ncbi:hypothetical protein F2P81_002543 [Scophthalmus maximus]|uniref:Uncharacterized protein n=1 Tax=Scophthalmus maximus TaxID=52904 RepID=A0A6A4TS05_SCOMX|nr:hypothetical protein F2P81_002543 [Scophthalmus maximus]
MATTSEPEPDVHPVPPPFERSLSVNTVELCDQIYFILPDSLAPFSEVMNSAQQLLRSQRNLLLTWTSDDPAPLLHWLRHAEVLSSEQHQSLAGEVPFQRRG